MDKNKLLKEKKSYKKEKSLLSLQNDWKKNIKLENKRNMKIFYDFILYLITYKLFKIIKG